MLEGSATAIHADVGGDDDEDDVVEEPAVAAAVVVEEEATTSKEDVDFLLLLSFTATFSSFGFFVFLEGSFVCVSFIIPLDGSMIPIERIAGESTIKSVAEDECTWVSVNASGPL